MAIYLFVTDPQIYTPEEIKAADGWWSCLKETKSGDEILVYLIGTGIKYLWQAVSVSRRHAHWGSVCDVRFLEEYNPAISERELKEICRDERWAAPHLNFPNKKAIRVPEPVATRILARRT